MEQMELPFMVEFEEGDKVKIVNKTLGDPLGVGWGRRVHAGMITHIGRVKISDVYTSIQNPPPIGTKYYIVHGGVFNGSDLRRVSR